MGRTTGLYSCPICVAPLTFRSADTKCRVCKSCGNPIHRLESDDLILADSTVITQSNDSITPGTTGRVEGREFEVIGRFRCWLDESVINYWTVIVEGSALCLLAEGYGMYALLRKTTLDKHVTTDELAAMRLIDTITLKDSAGYMLQKADKCWRYEIEGEVWMPECGKSFPIFDLHATGNKHLQLMEFLPGMLIAYEARYMTPSAMGLKDLNTADPKPLDLTCTQCHKPIPVRTFPYAQSCSCTECGARFSFKGGTTRSAGGDLGDGSAFRSSGKDKYNQNQLAIPLGAVGTLKDISYEVIGYAQKVELNNESISWKEYVLYNQLEGYAFLSEYAGNWIYTREKGDIPFVRDTLPSTIHAKGRSFQFYNRYRIKIVDTVGEFPYDAFGATAVESAEFIDPPNMWISESSQQGVIGWFWAEHVSQTELLQAFPGDLPASTEPSLLGPVGSGSMTRGRLLTVTAIAFAVLIGVHFLIGATRQPRILLEKAITIPDSAASMTFTSSNFVLSQWRSNLEFDIDAGVDNSWLELEASLVDANSGTEYAIDQPVEYYHGVDDGESWSDGTTNETAWLNSVPAGTYSMRIHLSKDSTIKTWTGTNCLLKVSNDVPTNRNLWIFLGLLSIYPIVHLIRLYLGEKRRWAASPYSPYQKQE